MRAARSVYRLAASGAYGVWLIVSRQYLSIVTAGILVLLAVLVLTSDSFESRDDSRTSAERDARPAPTRQPRPPRPLVLFYVVNDVAQRDLIASAVHSDRNAIMPGSRAPDYIFYLIAGTREEEAATIERLNFEELLARQSNVDMRVIDLRGRFD